MSAEPAFNGNNGQNKHSVHCEGAREESRKGRLQCWVLGANSQVSVIRTVQNGWEPWTERKHSSRDGRRSSQKISYP